MNAQPLWDWMNERHAIYMARQAGEPWPWTDDPILQEYSFCNVFRELDRVTIWVRENIRQPYAHHPNLWFMLAIARTINWPDTLQQIMDEGLWPEEDRWDAQSVADLLKEMGDRGEKVYTGAYMIRAESDPNNQWYNKTKHEYICHCVLGNLWRERLWWGSGLSGLTEEELRIHEAQPTAPLLNTLKRAWQWFTKFHGWGPFMSYEVVTDLRWTRYLDGAPDIYTWANAGPGALRGLNRLEGLELNAPRSPENATEAMRKLLIVANGEGTLDEGLFYWSGAHMPIEMRDIEHSLCETDKYLRAKSGEGRPRAKYNPPKVVKPQIVYE